MHPVAALPPPPKPPSVGVDFVAVCYLLAAAMTGVPLALTLLVSTVGTSRGWTEEAAAGSVAIAAVCTALAWNGWRLLRRRPRARERGCLSARGFVGFGVWGLVDALDPARRHGSVYVFLGGLMFIGGGLTAAVLLVVPSARRAFRPSPPGWYPDPADFRRWRAWDGARWTDAGWP